MLSNCGAGKTFESSLDSKEIKPVNPKGNQPWIFLGRTDAEAEAPVLWPPHAKSRLIGKDTDAGKDWGQEKGKTEDKMAGWHHWTKWTWVWANSRSWWRTGKPGMLQSVGSPRVRYDLAAEQHTIVLWPVMFNLQILNHEYFPLSFYLKKLCLKL